VANGTEAAIAEITKGLGMLKVGAQDGYPRSHSRTPRHLTFSALQLFPSPNLSTLPDRAALQQDLPTLHAAWWQAFWPANFLTLNAQPRLEQFYWIQVYKFASATRQGNALFDLEVSGVEGIA
jgi:hypothetical protein